MYIYIIRLLKQLAFLRSLAKTAYIEAPESASNVLERKMKSLEVSMVRSQNIKPATALEDYMAHRWRLGGADPSQSLPAVVTTCIRQFPVWSDESYNEEATTFVCHLLKTDRTYLASQFLPFVDDCPWSTYVKGRFHLSSLSFGLAALYFKKSAASLGEKFQPFLRKFY